MFDYSTLFRQKIEGVKAEGRYRIFANLTREYKHFPYAKISLENEEKRATIWCSNDYLGQGCNPKILQKITDVLYETGAGAGGTRNISGNCPYHKNLEQELSQLYNKESALLFTSGYVANETALSTLLQLLPNCVVFSDRKNHASIISGIRHSRATKHIFHHNNPTHLRELLQQYPKTQPKLIVFESVYSMDADFAKMREIIGLAKEFGALTYLDEVHAVGMYGKYGSGLAEQFSLTDKVDIIQGTLGKAIGCIGGYITASSLLVDMLRCHAPGFIFTTALPPALAAGAQESIKILRSPEGEALRKKHQENVHRVKQALQAKALPVLYNPSHIVPVMVENAEACQKISEMLLKEFDIYIQAINYPTVPHGEERLRITPTPFHTQEDIEKLAYALDKLWERFNLPRLYGAQLENIA